MSYEKDLEQLDKIVTDCIFRLREAKEKFRKERKRKIVNCLSFLAAELADSWRPFYFYCKYYEEEKPKPEQILECYGGFYTSLVHFLFNFADIETDYAHYFYDNTRKLATKIVLEILPCLPKP